MTYKIVKLKRFFEFVELQYCYSYTAENNVPSTTQDGAVVVVTVVGGTVVVVTVTGAARRRRDRRGRHGCGRHCFVVAGTVVVVTVVGGTVVVGTVVVVAGTVVVVTVVGGTVVVGTVVVVAGAVVWTVVGGTVVWEPSSWALSWWEAAARSGAWRSKRGSCPFGQAPHDRLHKALPSGPAFAGSIIVVLSQYDLEDWTDTLYGLSPLTTRPGSGASDGYSRQLQKRPNLRRPTNRDRFGASWTA